MIGGLRNSAADLIGPLREQAMADVAEMRVPSLSVAVFRNGQPLWVEAFGWADREKRQAATTSTVYAVASASKPFTASVITNLIASQRLSLDAPIGLVLTSLNPEVADLTLRELLQHQSGIPRHWRNHFSGQSERSPFEMVAREHAFTTAARSRRYLYSNLNYGLLAAVIEAETGDFKRNLRETVFEPLGLKSAGFLDGQFANWRAATPYEDDGIPIPPYRVDEPGARDLVMTAEDLARFGVAHLDGSLGVAAELMVSNRVQIDATGVSRASYGLGWIVEEDSPASLFTYGHTGEGPGAAASLSILPEEQLVVATLANAQGAPTYMLNEAIVDALSPRFAQRRAAHPYVDRAPDAAALTALMGRWQGRMLSSAGELPVELVLSPTVDGTLAVGDAPITALSRLAVTDRVLSGRADMRLPVREAESFPHQVRISLDVDGPSLDGAMAAHAIRGPIPHEQFWISYRLRLDRV